MIDMLIGSDCYWNLVTGGVSRSMQGPIAVHTRLGWVLYGPVATSELVAHLITTHVFRVDAQLQEKT